MERGNGSNKKGNHQNMRVGEGKPLNLLSRIEIRQLNVIWQNLVQGLVMLLQLGEEGRVTEFTLSGSLLLHWGRLISLLGTPSPPPLLGNFLNITVIRLCPESSNWHRGQQEKNRISVQDCTKAVICLPVYCILTLLFCWLTGWQNFQSFPSFSQPDLFSF